MKGEAIAAIGSPIIAEKCCSNIPSVSSSPSFWSTIIAPIRKVKIAAAKRKNHPKTTDNLGVVPRSPARWTLKYLGRLIWTAFSPLVCLFRVFRDSVYPPQFVGGDVRQQRQYHHRSRS
jgi:hypothetical protein